MCDPNCSVKEQCYAKRLTKLRPNVRKNWESREKDPEAHAENLLAWSFMLTHAPWVRFSVGGSTPPNPSDRWLSAMKKVADNLDHSKVHFPVETISKADTLKGIGFFPRVSLGFEHDKIESTMKAGFPVTVVTGTTRLIWKNRDRLAKEAHAKARELASKYQTTAKVCPAVIGKAKCGQCKLCARQDVGIVVYPLHK